MHGGLYNLSFQGREFLSFMVSFLAHIPLIVITVVPFGISSVQFSSSQQGESVETVHYKLCFYW